MNNMDNSTSQPGRETRQHGSAQPSRQQPTQPTHDERGVVLLFAAVLILVVMPVLWLVASALF